MAKNTNADELKGAEAIHQIAEVAAAEEPVANVEAPVEPPAKIAKKTASSAEQKVVRIAIEKLPETERKAAWKEYDNVKAGRLYLPPSAMNQAEILYHLAMAEAQSQFLSETAFLQQTPGQVLGELVRAGQYFLDRSGETCYYTMRQVVEGMQNQYYDNPEGLIEKTRQIVEKLRAKVLERQQSADGNPPTCAKATGKEKSADEGTSAEGKGAGERRSTKASVGSKEKPSKAQDNNRQSDNNGHWPRIVSRCHNCKDAGRGRELEAVESSSEEESDNAEESDKGFSSYQAFGEKIMSKVAAGFPKYYCDLCRSGTSIYECKECRVVLCIGGGGKSNCFEKWHTDGDGHSPSTASIQIFCSSAEGISSVDATEVAKEKAKRVCC